MLVNYSIHLQLLSSMQLDVVNVEEFYLLLYSTALSTFLLSTLEIMHNFFPKYMLSKALSRHREVNI